MQRQELCPKPALCVDIRSDGRLRLLFAGAIERSRRNELPIAVELSAVITDFPFLNRFLAILHFPTIFLDSIRRKGGRVVQCT